VAFPKLKFVRNLSKDEIEQQGYWEIKCLSTDNRVKVASSWPTPRPERGFQLRIEESFLTVTTQVSDVLVRREKGENLW
jgi:hypothetical protein